jgi:hypothetical protein
VQLLAEGHRPRSTALFELSEGGGFVESLPLPVGSRARVRLVADDGRRVELSAEILYYRVGDDVDPSGCGLAWVDLDDPARDVLNTMLSRAASGDSFRPKGE